MKLGKNISPLEKARGAERRPMNLRTLENQGESNKNMIPTTSNQDDLLLSEESEEYVQNMQDVLMDYSINSPNSGFAIPNMDVQDPTSKSFNI